MDYDNYYTIYEVTLSKIVVQRIMVVVVSLGSRGFKSHIFLFLYSFEKWFSYC